jgi:hypothetical protein
MDRFKAIEPNKPKDQLKKSGNNYSIRDKTTWKNVYTQLQKAREVYDGDKKGFWGQCKRGKRWIIDHSGPVRQVTKFVPDLDYVSPVLAAVEVLLDVSYLHFN